MIAKPTLRPRQKGRLRNSWLSTLTVLLIGLGSFAAVAGETDAAKSSQPKVASTVFAAASLTTALDAVAAAYKAQTGEETILSYAGSMTLAKQIEAGAPAEIFVSADVASMDYLVAKALVRPETRIDLLSNRLVLIAPRSSAIGHVELTKEELMRALGGGRIATGDVASVPVGKYAKAAFEKLGLWGEVAQRFAFAGDVRSAMTFVAREEAPLGVVYFTDAKSEPRVKIVAAFPDDSHPPIVYPAALTANAREGSERFFEFLKSSAARDIFTEHGFVSPSEVPVHK